MCHISQRTDRYVVIILHSGLSSHQPIFSGFFGAHHQSSPSVHGWLPVSHTAVVVLRQPPTIHQALSKKNHHNLITHHRCSHWEPNQLQPPRCIPLPTTPLQNLLLSSWQDCISREDLLSQGCLNNNCGRGCAEDNNGEGTARLLALVLNPQNACWWRVRGWCHWHKSGGKVVSNSPSWALETWSWLATSSTIVDSDSTGRGEERKTVAKQVRELKTMLGRHGRRVLVVVANSPSLSVCLAAWVQPDEASEMLTTAPQGRA